MQDTKSFSYVPPDPLIKRKKAPPLSGVRFYGFLIILCGLAFMTGHFNRTETWGVGPLFVVFTLIAIGLLLSGVSLQSTAFASVATLPNLNSYIRFTNFSLTLIEIFMTLFVAISFLQRRKLNINTFAVLSGGLFMACLASLIGSPLGLAPMGMLLRYGVLLLFVTILVSRPSDKSLFKPVFYGLLSIPLIACFTYAGEGYLWIMFTANLLGFSRVVYSFQYPIWFSLFLPFLVFIRAPRFIVMFASLVVIFIIVLSFARSIIIGAAAAGILYILFYKDTKPVARIVSKAFLLIALGIVFFSVAVVFNYFDFISSDPESFDQSGSNASRYAKMAIAVEAIKAHPLLGSGFGAANDRTFAEQKSREEVFAEGINPEFGPLNVLAEIGLIGGCVLFSIIIISSKYSIKCLRDRTIPMSCKLVVLITFGGFVSSFLNSNSLNLIVVYIFLVTPILLFKHWRSSSRLLRHADVVATSQNGSTVLNTNG
jgi:hypothetical protein